MKVVFLTLALDAMPFITLHYPEFRKLPFLWEWRISEGVAAPISDTSWVKQIPPRLSNDGTTQYLDALAAFDPRVILFRSALWPGKTAMLNAALKTVNEPCLLMEIDSDEIWTTAQIENVRRMFMGERSRDDLKKTSAWFRCRYFVGPNIVITNTDGEHYGNRQRDEWRRAWRIVPGTKFEKHEPPVISGMVEVPFTHAETATAGLVFDHFAYATEAQVAFKAEYYGSVSNKNSGLYKDAVLNWRRLQENRKWPVSDLRVFLPWVGPGVTADKI